MNARAAAGRVTLTRPRSKPASRLRRWLRRLGVASLISLLLVFALWIAIHRIPWLGPAIADGVRSVVGPEPVAWAEDVAYGIQDRVDQWRYGDEPPKTYWEPPKEAAAAPVVSAAPAAPPSWMPKPFEAPFPKVASAADGIWVAVPDPQEPRAPVTMYKTLVHPDPRRPHAVLAVVAVDLTALDLHLVAGTTEPISYQVKAADRPGLVPAEHTAALVAAFNGGFKATHGNYGMGLGGVDFLPPRDFACAFARYRDGSYGIGTWKALKSAAADMSYYRQTPPCLVEDGKVHSLLHYHEYAKGWGATVSGETVIRRSAIALDRDEKVMFYGIGDAITAQSLARGMQAAGGHSAAELDVNYSYPRFLVYERPDAAAPPIAGSCLIPDVDFTKDEYVTRPSPRDFFYLARGRRQAAL